MADTSTSGEAFDLYDAVASLSSRDPAWRPVPQLVARGAPLLRNLKSTNHAMNTASEDIRFALINGTTYRVVRNAVDSRVGAVQIEGLKREYCDVSLDEVIAHQAIWRREHARDRVRRAKRIGGAPWTGTLTLCSRPGRR